MDREALIHRKDHGNEDGNGRESRFSDGNGFMNEATVTFLNDNLFQQEEEPEEEDDSESTDPPPESMEAWQFPGWGRLIWKEYPDEGLADKTDAIAGEMKTSLGTTKTDHPKLGQWASTAISGNDITSSCLYVSGLCAATAGRLAPIALLAVGMMLYLFRAIYGEVGTALPVNGGAYNVLLNSTSKGVASLAACLTLLSYVATGVVSGSDACVYLNTIWNGLSIEGATIAILFVFACLVLWGVGESAGVALAIFIMHMLTLTSLIIASFIHFGKQGTGILRHNWNDDTTPPDSVGTSVTWASSLFFGTSSAMLGLSGFETSANFIEEQKEGVFPKTLRNMWISVIILNPLLSLLAMANMKMDDIYNHSEDLLSHLALTVGGKPFQIVISVDAFIVLSGAVLTSYVGVCGLARRMAMDRCLPGFLLNQNRFRKTNHYIIIGFFLVASSLYIMLGGNVSTLSGVYTVSFLSVMTLFALGSMLLKWKRPALPRTIKASWLQTAVAACIVAAGLVGNILRNPTMVQYFVLYFGCTLLIVAIMFYRTFLLKIILAASRGGIDSRKGGKFRQKISKLVTDQVRKINEEACVFFAKQDDLPTLNKAILYVRDNEQTGKLVIVHALDGNEKEPSNLKTHVRFLDQTYPKLRIDLLIVKAFFGPKLVETLSRELNIPQNMMFVACPDADFPHKLGTLGGLRVITRPARKVKKVHSRRPASELTDHIECISVQS